MNTLTTEGRLYAVTHRDSIVCRVALAADYDRRYGTTLCLWPMAFQQTSIDTINQEATRA